MSKSKAQKYQTNGKQPSYSSLGKFNKDDQAKIK